MGLWWCIYTSVNCVIIGLGYGLLPVWCQPITRNNANSLPVESQEQNKIFLSTIWTDLANSF